MELETIKSYLGVDCNDDDSLIEIIVGAIIEDFEELIPNFDKENMSSRQKLLFMTYVQEFYDNRTLFEEKNSSLRQSISSMLIKEIYGGNV
ncbi:phage gp6-like head-tail connector protein [Clostridium botulinum]|nr:phage gp6-like head-tail connector protein [Clostridium botulinum]